MFNVSALLLDDALKPATPLTNGAINEMLRQTLDISQGSVATHLRCGGIFSDSITTIFFLLLTVKKILKLIIAYTERWLHNANMLQNVRMYQRRLTPTMDGRSTPTSGMVKHNSPCLGWTWRHDLTVWPCVIWILYNAVVRISTILSYVLFT